ncbi:asparaginase domain-containing protein [Paenibacillus sp. LHD-117]|uniref:asparaginase n=1 Tax=Paenibacillus sp. LHD-117 TaxID=3071412 RepID=UPI0027DFAF86|nr:asparaginase domain-containing protein [Paenibacillus sp. LHD-117]MDQ6420145.1 asparaginase domain-containing protein [Paenibacillus sp. LHD-117]
MKRLLVIFTGGTIGSKAEGRSINVHDSGSYALLEAYEGMEEARPDVELTTLQPLNLLSENLTADDWRTLAAAIRKTDPGSYDGVIVTHGSDTLAYTAPMLSYLFSDIAVPLILTASNYPIADARANGLRNLAASIDFVADAALPGVFAVYENDRGEMLVYLATRIIQCESFTDQFRSPYELPFGRMEDRRFVWQDDARNPRPESLGSARAALRWEPESLKLDDTVLYIRPYPGLNYSLYRWEDQERRPSAILHDLHHSGTACALASGPYSLPAFISRCKEQGIDVYLSPLKDASDALYASSHELIEAGAVFLEGICMEAALTKLIAAYGIADDAGQARAWMAQETIFYEKVPAGGEGGMS